MRLSNGNTAGATGSSAAQIMAQRTGVSASTWAAIIARESNGQVMLTTHQVLPGLFQTMPGWGQQTLLTNKSTQLLKHTKHKV